MAKGKGGKSELLGPLYTKPAGQNLGPHRVEGNKGGMAVPDPMGFAHGQLRHGPSGEQRSQSHDKE